MFHGIRTGIRLRRLAQAGLLLAATLAVSACEDKGLGRLCNLTFDAGPSQGAYTVQASDCPSRICNRPAIQDGVSPDDVDTGPYCTVTCTSDSDCNGETRDFNNGADRRCKSGYSCAIPYGQGKLCCQKVCLCRDFFLPANGPVTPSICQNGGSCS